MAFYQEPPRLTNAYDQDRVLGEHLARLLPPEVFDGVEPELREMGEAAAGTLLELAARVEADPPRLIQYDPWGRRIDRVEVSPAWLALQAWQARGGICALPYEDRHGPHDRVVQHSLDLLRSERKGTLSSLLTDLDERLESARELPQLASVVALIESDRAALATRARAWGDSETDVVHAGMHAYAMRLGRCYAAALLVEHSAHRLRQHDDVRAAMVARRYAQRWLSAPLPEINFARLDESLVVLGVAEAAPDPSGAPLLPA